MKTLVVENYFSRLQKAVEARGIDLPRLASDTKIALSTMYRWKESVPQARTRSQIADYLRVSDAWLVSGDGEMEANANTMSEDVRPYHFTPRGHNPQPSSSTELLSGCVALLNAMPHAATKGQFDYAVLSFEELWQRLKAAKYSELE